VLDHVSFALQPGSLTALVGPNGAGKSTLLQAMEGQLNLSGGSITWEGTPLTPALARQQGVWRGTWRRFDAEGGLLETFPSTITIRVVRQDGRWRYHQINLFGPENAPARRIEAHGEIHSGRVWFSSDRYEGWAMDLPGEESASGGLLVMRARDPADPDVHEIISCSPDGHRRWRVSQLLRQGRLIGRTVIDEERVTGQGQSPDR